MSVLCLGCKKEQPISAGGLFYTPCECNTSLSKALIKDAKGSCAYCGMFFLESWLDKNGRCGHCAKK